MSFHPSGTLNKNITISLATNKWQVFQNCLPLFKDICWRDLSMNTFIFSLFVVTSANFFLAFRQKVFFGVVKTAFHLSIATICRKIFFPEKYLSPKILGHSLKIYWSFFNTVSVRLTKLHFKSPKDKFSGHTFVLTKFLLLFSYFSNIEKKIKFFFVEKQYAR